MYLYCTYLEEHLDALQYALPPYLDNVWVQTLKTHARIPMSASSSYDPVLNHLAICRHATFS